MKRILVLLTIILGFGLVSMSFMTNTKVNSSTKVEIKDNYKLLLSNITFCDPDGQTCGSCNIYKKDNILYATASYYQIEYNRNSKMSEFQYRFYHGSRRHWCYLNID